VSRNGAINYTSEIPHTYLGISNKLIISNKELVSIQTLFSIRNFIFLDEMPKSIQINLQDYYKNYTNSYIYEPTMKDNRDELDIKDFYNFYQKAKTLMKKFQIIVKIELVEERNNFFIYKCILSDNQTEIERNNQKSLDLNLLRYFKEETKRENIVNFQDDLGNLIKFEEAYTMSAMNNSASESSGREYFSSMNKIIKKRNDNKNNKFLQAISRIIWWYNTAIALLGIVFLIYIKLISSNVLNIYEVVKDIRIINSNYIDCMTHIVQLIVLNESEEYDSLEKKAKMQNNKIYLNLSNYLRDEFKQLSNKVFVDRTKTNTDLLAYIDLTFLKNNLDTNTTNVGLDGLINSFPFLEVYQHFANLVYQLSNGERYYTNFPVININSEVNVKMAFGSLSIRERIILSLIYNYKYMNEKFFEIDKIMTDYFDSVYSDFKNKVYILFVIIIIVHIISIVLSLFELFIYRKNLLIFIKEILVIRKKALKYIYFKLKSAKNLVDLENQPS